MQQRRETLVLGIFAPVATGAAMLELIREAIRFHRGGADIVDLDMLVGGPFAGVDDDTVALLIRALREAGVPVSVTTTDARIARIGADCGARWIVDPSGATADPRMLDVAARFARVGWVLGPWSAGRAMRYRPASSADDYADGLLRNLACLQDAGVRSDRIVLHASAGLAADDPDPWRMLDHLERLSALGYPVLVDARDELLASMTQDASEARLADAAVGLAALAVSVGAWGVRTRAVDRVAGNVHHLLASLRTPEPIG